MSNRTKSQGIYKLLLIWPYAIAPAVAAILWRFLCHPSLGWLTQFLQVFGIHFDYMNNAKQALIVIILTASWQQFSYNFLFYYAALKAVPKILLRRQLWMVPELAAFAANYYSIIIAYHFFSVDNESNLWFL